MSEINLSWNKLCYQLGLLAVCSAALMLVPLYDPYTNIYWLYSIRLQCQQLYCQDLFSA